MDNFYKTIWGTWPERAVAQCNIFVCLRYFDNVNRYRRSRCSRIAQYSRSRYRASPLR